MHIFVLIGWSKQFLWQWPRSRRLKVRFPLLVWNLCPGLFWDVILHVHNGMQWDHHLFQKSYTISTGFVTSKFWILVNQLPNCDSCLRITCNFSLYLIDCESDKFDAATAVLIKNQVFWDIADYIGNRYILRGVCCPHLQRKARAVDCPEAGTATLLNLYVRICTA